MFKTEKVVINGKEYTRIEYRDFVFMVPTDDKKFRPDLEKVAAILDKEPETITAFDRVTLLNIYKVAYHESGKIEGIFSLDSSSTNCKFCQEMREAAKNNPAHICGMCYDFAQEQFRFNVVNRHSLNLMIMKTILFTVEELKTLAAGQLVRINSSGDTENLTYAKNMINYAFAHPFSNVAYWAKNTLPIIQACEELGKPANLILIQSSPIIGVTAKLLKFFDYVFTVYATKEAVKEAVKNGACECNGKKCKECGYSCYFGKWEKGSNIAEYLRGISKEKRKALVAAGVK